jgi:hypothetical protein
MKMSVVMSLKGHTIRTRWNPVPGSLAWLPDYSWYLLVSVVLRRKHLARAFIEATRIVFKYKIKFKRLPKGLIRFNPKTWVYLWALKCLLQRHPDAGPEECIRYGVQRASLEYVMDRFLRSGVRHRRRWTPLRGLR